MAMATLWLVLSNGRSVLRNGNLIVTGLNTMLGKIYFFFFEGRNDVPILTCSNVG